MESSWTPEPWADTGSMNPERFVEIKVRDYHRARACVNALAGVATKEGEDPAAAIRTAREALTYIRDAFANHVTEGAVEVRRRAAEALALITPADAEEASNEN